MRWVTRQERLPALVGRSPSRQFPTMMAEHHEGGAYTAEPGKRQAACGPTKTLIGDIVISQTAEIARMRTIPNVAPPWPTKLHDNDDSPDARRGVGAVNAPGLPAKIGRRRSEVGGRGSEQVHLPSHALGP
ncbi:DUF305 domain-containing protein [Streptomyces sp. NPDC058745]|uniref:DUF305 domain-containing protein n=1 Tax=Streptomyces sp. NPDC058745 TaxID=3346621 RepID=UPI0036C1FC1B